MRKGYQWRDSLLQEFITFESAYGRLEMSPAELLDTELVLTLFADHFPDQDPGLAWALLGGYDFPALEEISPEAQRALAIARHRLRDLLGRQSWQRRLARYKKLLAPYPLYQIQNRIVHLQSTPVIPERLTVIREALTTPPPWLTVQPAYATPGTYRFTDRQEVHEVTIPAQVIRRDIEPQVIPTAPRIRKPLHVALVDLRMTAQWMDSVIPSNSSAARDWTGWMNKLDLQLVTEHGLKSTQRLTVMGLCHLVGMLGSGKSSFFTVLAVWLARQGKRVVLVQGDVASLLREVTIFDALGLHDSRIRSVPLIGRSTRITHLNRLLVAETHSTGPSLRHNHPALSFLSTICPLDGLRSDVAPIAPGREPCTRLYQIGEDSELNARRDCPLMPHCPVHHPTRQLLDASIWLATPASLLASRPQTPLVNESLSYAELVMRVADVVLIDEADLVQIQFDDQFAQVETLVGKQDSWLDRLAMHVARQVYRPGRPLIGTSTGLDRWLTAHMHVQRTVDRIYQGLRESTTLRTWLSTSYFSGMRLFQKIQQEWKDLGWDEHAFESAFHAFHSNPFGRVRPILGKPHPPEAWERAIQSELVLADTPTALAHLQEWIEIHCSADPVSTPRIMAEADHIRLALLVVVLDHALQDLIAEWGNAADLLEIDRGSGGLFFAPSDNLVRIIPEAPMGAVLGFQYFDSDGHGDGELRFFRVRGVGRALLYRLHNGFTLSDEIAGPNVIVTSGTSVAPGSWRYDLHYPPQAVLCSTEKPIIPDGIIAPPRVWCSFEPLQDPDRPARRLTVSGQPPHERLRSMRAMVTELARPSAVTKMSVFDHELALLDEDRKRILLIVGSYEEALDIAETLSAALRVDPGERVVALIPDSEHAVEGEGKLPRSMLRRVADLSVTYLVAPLQAIERGHNILVGQQAAIGSVYFFARPLPVPGDPHMAIHRLHDWAMRTTPTLTGLSAPEAGKVLRQQGHHRWDQELKRRYSYQGINPDERDALLWTSLVLVWQCIGRLLRGGVNARVHFIDAKWAPISSGLQHGSGDTPETSMLLGFRDILRTALQHQDPAYRELIEALYGDFAMALETIKGVY